MIGSGSVVDNWEFCLERNSCDRNQVCRDTCVPPGWKFTKNKGKVMCPCHTIWSVVLSMYGTEV